MNLTISNIIIFFVKALTKVIATLVNSVKGNSCKCQNFEKLINY